jgi:NAD(P)-dependent dehydrogenase (short-subunit alcohol dehydrogenase family)
MATVAETFLDIEPMDLSATCIQKDSLKDEVAVVTGSTSNVGLGYVRAIAWAGGKVVVSGNNEKAGNEIMRVIDAENAPGTAMFVKCNVTSESDVKNLFKQAVDRFGKVDILVNNAMNLSLNGPVLASPVSDLEQSFAISGLGVMYTLKEFVPDMLKRKHGVVVYSTTQFHYSPPMIGGAIYCAGKAVATSLTMSLANELGPYSECGVGVFCMIPSGVGRPRSAPAAPNRAQTPPSPYGFDGPIPPEANAAGLVYSIMNAGKLHGSGISVVDAFAAMNYPYPHPESVRPVDMRRLNDRELTLVFRNMGPGFNG